MRITPPTAKPTGSPKGAEGRAPRAACSFSSDSSFSVRVRRDVCGVCVWVPSVRGADIGDGGGLT